MGELASGLDVPGVVAVVDDDDGISSALQSWLMLMSVKARTFDNGQSLLNALQADPGGVWTFRASDQVLSAAILDLNLPGQSGFEVARSLRAHAPQLNIIVITAASEDAMEMLGGIPTGVSIVGKPFNLFELESLLKPL